MDAGLLFAAFVLLAATSLLVPLSKLSGLGSVVGYIIAGILVGPQLLGVITEPEAVLHFSEFGVVMMLFLIGLELKPRELYQMRAKLLGLGGAQVGLTMIAVTGAAIVMGYLPGSALVIGMAFALSSTAIAMQLLAERNLLATPLGRSGLAILLFQDVIVIAMIAVLPVLATATGIVAPIAETGDAHHGGLQSPDGLWRIGAILAVFAGMILAGRVVLNPVFRLIARSNVRETFTAISLSLVIGASLLMGWLGLSAALGAFIAGVVLAESQYRHQLERDIEPFKALLLGFFFMSVGMSLDFAAIGAAPLTIIGGVVGLVSLKAAILFGLGRVMKLGIPSSLLLAVILGQAGEFGFVLFQFAYIEGLMDPALISTGNAIIAISMAMTPILLVGFDRLVSPRFVSAKLTGEPPIDRQHKVLILGFGRVAQVAARLLHTQDIETTLLDHDGDHIEFVRQFGDKVFYGDAGDIDLLRKAGAGSADVIIIAIDNPTKATQVARNIREYFPAARIVARARNRPHMFDLMAVGVDFVERETVRGALALGRSALELLGVPGERARQLSDDFLTEDFKQIEESWQHRDDLKTLIDKHNTALAMMKRTLNAEKQRNEDD